MHKELAFAGGNSDARNKLILTMFNNINIGERTGSGIPLILNATKDEGYTSPTFEDFFSPDYTLVTIYLKNLVDSQFNLEVNHNNLEVTNEKLEIPTLISKLDIRGDLKSNLLDIYNKMKDIIFSNSLIVEKLDCSSSSADNYIKVLKANNLVIPVKGKGKGRYKFK